ncbi:fructosamine kinase family protein [uncultured Anaerococcus sp.]|uniref:fructosamine kinase family protein n=1 Tax=uncultured Anaerococcus sp. TaxID=293428 RepID=UPI00261E7A7A|nr:fructosamine kinase family protein [uncultured Anaerococcus sp.]
MKNLPIDNIKDIRVANGGDVNDAYKIYTDDEIYFMLVQQNSEKSFYDGEIEGLKLFEKVGIRAPRVIANGHIDGDSYLVLSYLEEGGRGSQSKLAETVAKIHFYKSPNSKFGFDYPHNGSDTSFSNEWTDSWSDLFINQRLDKLSKYLLDLGYWTDYDLEKYQKVRDIIVNQLAKHKSEPSLVHGDLWAGNYMFLKDGTPALFDPSPFYGDREFDIGITTVFGGFSDEFYNRYKQIYPLDENYKIRLEFYRLYLYMVHLVKFGEMYESSVNMTMDNILGY